MFTTHSLQRPTTFSTIEEQESFRSTVALALVQPMHHISILTAKLQHVRLFQHLSVLSLQSQAGKQMDFASQQPTFRSQQGKIPDGSFKEL